MTYCFRPNSVVRIPWTLSYPMRLRERRRYIRKMAESGDAAHFKWTDEHTRLLIQWRVANEALFTGRRNAAIKEQKLDGKISAAQVKRKWENLKPKYKAIGGRQSITPPTLIASSGSDVAVTSPSSVRSTAERAGRKRKDIEELMYEMEEREAAREMEAGEREERRWREMMEREERRDENKRLGKEKKEETEK
ncbi:Potassium-transporting ATPase KdpC subunit [Labeo rohita]|uniref:Potassium-transporting ATPase KdpC subunit n=1 Tax=Labeo rohita TaxID=84645 RepID=A0ABQ8L0V1_LABRO|nr:Potassium-transporting ATPase KdpC subunit [Labeo rohita]